MKLILSVILAAACLLLCQQIIVNSMANQQNKQDFAEVRHIKYGLFSINEWKRQLALIIADELTKLNLSNANEIELKKHVELQLNGLIDNVEAKIKKANKGTVSGWMKQSVINAVVDMKDIKDGIPSYADAIIVQMTKVKTEKLLKAALAKRVKEYFDQTFEKQDLDVLNSILVRTNTPDIDVARIKLAEEIEKNQALIFQQTWLFIFIASLQFIICGFGKRILPAPQYLLLLLTLAALLVAGVATPMIDMEAKISAMRFTLLDHPISFENQVLYFQTKSILDVFWIMITHEDIQMKVVGILMVLFSVVFPIFKMLSSLFYYYDFHRARANKWIQFFVLKSGKWSMTDVLIVAIFMAYIGFNGIITSQFGNLQTTGQEIVILTTNGTSLQPGFYMFLTYTMLALFLSGFLTRVVPEPSPDM
ncbi:MAG TPA: paraquat-inducible protein A [Oligoflexus sp.]|uniref:paraquat-inducible protein A n=1 Tax=Oligoflexus sp. TaxID=1971216 RepID=UPI002D58888F|nr:paraquat-inducible protein A [Oligoflexus sp.]HYX32332.1 paraquat-inducible protein A [Oligoflexus sp.]